MAHLSYDKFDELEDRIKLFDTEYLISYEKEKYEHFHFIVNITDTEYHNFAQDYFKKKYQLRGRAGRKGTPDEGKPRQYGKETTIRDLEKSISYTLKDSNYRTNMCQSYIDEMIEKSFKKNEKETDMKKLFEHLDGSASHWLSIKHKEYYENDKVKLWVNKEILEDIYTYIISRKDIKLSLSRTAINNYFLKYLRTTQHLDVYDKVRMSMKFNNHM